MSEDIEFRDLDGAPGTLFSNEKQTRAIEALDSLGSTDDLDIHVETKENAESLIGTPTESHEGDLVDSDDDVDIDEESEEDELDISEEDEDEEKESEDEEEEEEDDTPEMDEDLKPYHPKVQKRIMRERKLKREVQTQLDTERSALQRANQRIQDLEVANQRTAYSAYSALDRASEYDLKEAKATLVETMEAGDTDKQVDAQLEVNRVQAIREKIVAQKETFSNRPDIATGSDPGNINVNTAAPSNGLTNEARAWVGANSSWIMSNTREAQEALAFAQQIDGNFGGDPNSSEYFDTLNRLITAKFPNIKTSPSQLKEKAKSKPKKKIAKKKGKIAGVPAEGSTYSNAPRSKTKVVITREDKANMRVFGLNPEDKVQLKEYALNKAALN